MEEDEENAVKVEIDLSLNKTQVIEKIKNFCFLHFSKKKFNNFFIENELSKQLLNA